MPEYPQEREIVLDGTQWSLFIRQEGRRGRMVSGDNRYPESWDRLLALLGIRYEGDDEDEDGGPLAPDEVIYCLVSFDDFDRTYYYRTDNPLIRIGDTVTVPFGAGNIERDGTVMGRRRYRLGEVPFPLERTKSIISR